MISEAAARIEALVGDLRAQGRLGDPRIVAALHAVPRHWFAPERGWCAPDGPGPRRAIDRAADESGWWDAVYSDASIVTQAADGAADPAAGSAEATSSLSAPGAVVAFLELLDVRPGERVLEIGTGTGWTAALLTALGADVTTMEIDPAIVSDARRRLAAAGADALVITGDGAEGVPGGGAFDGVHVTCAVTQFPYAWVEQTRPGGRIAAPWQPEFGEGHKVLLSVTADGRAIGPLCGAAHYMMLRSQRGGFQVPEDTAGAAETGTRLDPRQVTDDGSDAAIAGMLPDVMAVPRREAERFELLLADTGGTSWARVQRTDGAEHRVLQAGPRRLWDEVADAYLRWVGWGRPERSRFGMTVGPDGHQVIWRDDPSHIITPATERST
ncbi:methyltransferase domain-containing protein [Actinomadura graeca]|uniref:Protein-L-isoaspartate O-methyltransferase n=1 Tax=Actinomadura graeca TaxID=2750812 RepID=A0ABX8QSV5_9ACTN|nr:methyltransferase domain-containing protein [Actinomadura graeca]QXJ21875.1 methyltransferase domain-containing protein [Actinomadura graeca]